MTYPNFRIIIVDNGSTDGSREQLEAEFPHVTLVRHTKNLGFTGGVNAGLREARRQQLDWYMALNNDTVVDPEMLTELVNVAESDQRIGGLNPCIYHMQPSDRIWHARGFYNWWTGTTRSDEGRSGSPLSEPAEVTFLTGGALMIRAEAAEHVGVLDDRFFIYSEDVDYTTRLRKAGYRTLFVPAAKVWHQEHGDINDNAESGFRVYWTTRNRLLIMTKHASPVQWLTFLPVFVFWYVGARLVAYLVRRQWDRIPSLFGGIRAFFALRGTKPLESW